MKLLLVVAPLLVLMARCSSAPTTIHEPATESTESETELSIYESRKSSRLQASIEHYFANHSTCAMATEIPLTLQNLDQPEQPIHCEHALTQLDMNLCAQAAVCLEIQHMKLLLPQVMPETGQLKDAFLEELLNDLDRMDQMASEAGKHYEGGSMQPMVISNKLKDLLAQKNKALMDLLK